MSFSQITVSCSVALILTILGLGCSTKLERSAQSLPYTHSGNSAQFSPLPFPQTTQQSDALVPLDHSRAKLYRWEQGLTPYAAVCVTGRNTIIWGGQYSNMGFEFELGGISDTYFEIPKSSYVKTRDFSVHTESAPSQLQLYSNGRWILMTGGSNVSIGNSGGHAHAEASGVRISGYYGTKHGIDGKLKVTFLSDYGVLSLAEFVDDGQILETAMGKYSR